MALPVVSLGQHSMADYINHRCDVFYIGLDFQKAKMVGPDFNDPASIVSVFFRSWNNLVLNEADKYRVPQRLKSLNLRYEMGVVEGLNLKVDPSKLVQYNSHSITEDDVKAAVKNYDLSALKDGIAIGFVVESFDKTTESGTAWVTFIDVASKNVIYTERLMAKAGGFGFKNYWAKAMFGWLETIDRTQFNLWRNKFGK